MPSTSPAAGWRCSARSAISAAPGLPRCAISAVDTALWDLKARLLGPAAGAVCSGAAASSVPIYGSGGFTTYTDEQLRDAARRLGRARRLPLRQDEDRHRAGARSAARRAWRKAAIGDAELFVDANGAFSVKQALALRRSCAESRHPLVRGAGLLGRSRRACADARARAGRRWRSPPANTSTRSTMSRRMLEAGAVDVLQADVTRCGGITGFLQVGGALRGASHRSLRPLRAGAASPRRLRGAAAAPPRMVSRSCADRADAVRRRAGGRRTA